MAAEFINFSGENYKHQSVSEEDYEQLEFQERYALSKLFHPETDGRDKIVFSVVDSGVGISQEKRVHLFKLFGYIQSVEQQNNNGIGLGLSISDKIVKAFNGQFGFKSQENIGSQFSFSIVLDSNIEPRVETSTMVNNILASQPPSDSLEQGYFPVNMVANYIPEYLNQKELERANENTGKILVVDDEQYNLDIINTFLSLLGLDRTKNEVVFCSDGEQSMKLIRESILKKDPLEYSLILTDCNMPFMDGYEATKKMRKEWASIGIPVDQQPRICAITGHIEEHYIKKASDSGMNNIFSKPIHISTICDLLKDSNFEVKMPVSNA